MQYSVEARNNWLDSIETTLGPSPILEIRTGAPPANCSAANTGAVLATINLPVDWAANASGGQKDLLGIWSDPDADAGGEAGHFRVFESDGVTCHMQGTAGEAADNPDMVLQNKTFVAGQPITITQFRQTAGNA